MAIFVGYITTSKIWVRVPIVRKNWRSLNGKEAIDEREEEDDDHTAPLLTFTSDADNAPTESSFGLHPLNRLRGSALTSVRLLPFIAIN